MESNHVRDLMEAYSSIYTENEEVEQLDEDFQGAVKRTLDAGAKATDNFMKTPVGKVIRPFVSPVGKGQGTVTADQQKAKIIQKQSFDLFDIIKGHLLDEGFADTEEAALAIMTNMSEEWRESIVEEVLDEAKVDKYLDNKLKKSNVGDDETGRSIRKDIKISQRRKRASVTPDTPRQRRLSQKLRDNRDRNEEDRRNSTYSDHDYGDKGSESPNLHA